MNIQPIEILIPNINKNVLLDNTINFQGHSIIENVLVLTSTPFQFQLYTDQVKSYIYCDDTGYIDLDLLHPNYELNFVLKKTTTDLMENKLNLATTNIEIGMFESVDEADVNGNRRNKELDFLKITLITRESEATDKKQYYRCSVEEFNSIKNRNLNIHGVTVLEDEILFSASNILKNIERIESSEFNKHGMSNEFNPYHQTTPRHIESMEDGFRDRQSEIKLNQITQMMALADFYDENDFSFVTIMSALADMFDGSINIKDSIEDLTKEVKELKESIEGD